MGDKRLYSELERLRRAVGPRLCSPSPPCRTVTASEMVLRPDGTEERIGARPRPPCDGCPERESRRVRHVEVVLDRRNRHGDRAQQAVSAATVPPVGPDGTEEEHGSPETADAPMAPESKGNILPAAWGSEHPARLAAPGLESPEKPRGRGDEEGFHRFDSYPG